MGRLPWWPFAAAPSLAHVYTRRPDANLPFGGPPPAQGLATCWCWGGMVECGSVTADGPEALWCSIGAPEGGLTPLLQSQHIRRVLGFVPLHRDHPKQDHNSSLDRPIGLGQLPRDLAVMDSFPTLRGAVWGLRRPACCPGTLALPRPPRAAALELSSRGVKSRSLLVEAAASKSWLAGWLRPGQPAGRPSLGGLGRPSIKGRPEARTGDRSMWPAGRV